MSSNVITDSLLISSPIYIIHTLYIILYIYTVRLLLEKPQKKKNTRNYSPVWVYDVPHATHHWLDKTDAKAVTFGTDLKKRDRTYSIHLYIIERWRHVCSNAQQCWNLGEFVRQYPRDFDFIKTFPRICINRGLLFFHFLFQEIGSGQVTIHDSRSNRTGISTFLSSKIVRIKQTL